MILLKLFVLERTIFYGEFSVKTAAVCALC